MNRLAIVPAVLLVGALLFGTTGCADPCATLPAPTLSEQAANDDIERDVNGTECDWEDGRWEADHDYAKSSKKTSAARKTTKAPKTTKFRWTYS